MSLFHRVVLFLVTAVLALSDSSLRAQWAPLTTDAKATQRIGWWREARVGMFMHWGGYSILGRGEWAQWNEQIPVSGRDGNFLFNVGPRPDGQIEPSQAARIREIGRWLQTNGESFYGTRGGPWLPGAYGVSTHKGKYLYIHLLRVPQGSTLSLPALPIRVAAASLLNGPELKFTASDGQVTIDFPSGTVDAIDTVIKLELDEPWTTSAVVPVTYISG